MMTSDGHSPTRESSTPSLSLLAAHFAESAVLGDEAACFASFRQALETGASMVDIHQDFLSAGMRHVGDWWHDRKIDVAAEHMASEITERLTHATAFHFGQAPRNGLQVLLGGGPEGWHVIGLRMIGDVLRHRGWHSMYLGPNVPTLSFVETVRVNRPDLVLMSCSAAESVRGTINLLNGLAAFRRSERESHKFLVGVGGMLAPEHRDSFLAAGADFTGTDLRTFIQGPVQELEEIGATGGDWSSARMAAF